MGEDRLSGATWRLPAAQLMAHALACNTRLHRDARQDFYELKHRAIQWMVDPVEDGGLGLDPATAATIVSHEDGGYLIATVYTKLAQLRALARAPRVTHAYQQQRFGTDEQRSTRSRYPQNNGVQPKEDRDAAADLLDDCVAGRLHRRTRWRDRLDGAPAATTDKAFSAAATNNRVGLLRLLQHDEMLCWLRQRHARMLSTIRAPRVASLTLGLGCCSQPRNRGTEHRTNALVPNVLVLSIRPSVSTLDRAILVLVR
jgi:hypothetical protein